MDHFPFSFVLFFSFILDPSSTVQTFSINFFFLLLSKDVTFDIVLWCWYFYNKFTGNELLSIKESPFIPQSVLSVRSLLTTRIEIMYIWYIFPFPQPIFNIFKKLHCWSLPLSLTTESENIESMEEEATTTTRSLLLKQKLDNSDQWSSSDHGGVQLSESSPTTTSFVVLISTLVAVCGSYTFGNAVSTVLSTITILF